jgi:hypothetical protein
MDSIMKLPRLEGMDILDIALKVVEILHTITRAGRRHGKRRRKESEEQRGCRMSLDKRAVVATIGIGGPIQGIYNLCCPLDYKRFKIIIVLCILSKEA